MKAHKTKYKLVGTRYRPYSAYHYDFREVYNRYNYDLAIKDRYANEDTLGDNIFSEHPICYDYPGGIDFYPH